ncbi:hypothetical protein LPJ59_002663 [Coemansia sp. RSA 2399]|nr:hypothetical protein LPJ59_002663 [Coemansia sp. RSA 2399]KAJ1904295.1 hypothetical protein LPJ81_002577 [Coemansia sp. IMI 209127]
MAEQHESPPPPDDDSLFTQLGMHPIGDGTSSAGTQQLFIPNMEVEIVSLARYTFVDPAVASRGPAPLEPPIDRGRNYALHPMSTQIATDPPNNQMYDEDGAIAEFTEERSNRQLSRIARRLLLPDFYAEACYELHAFMDAHPVLIDSVQRNVFKCLKICARLSKLHGYSIHLMWQVIAQAHKRVGEFTEERARTIGLWFSKLTNRIRMMTVSPAADGSAPPRLPTHPPAQLLDARARGKLLPLPEINTSALKGSAFRRTTESSESSYYLANPIGRKELPPLPPIQIEEIREDEENPDDGAEGNAVVEGNAPVEEEGGQVVLSELPPILPTEESDAELLQSNREAELMAIEHQLRELERIPPRDMGPMLRAALNLLVEMRFRLQLGLPRAISDDSSSDTTTPVSLRGNALPPAPRLYATEAFSTEAYGEDANDEERVIDYVLNQISTSRRQYQMNQHTAVMNSSATRGIYANNWHNLGAPLYMRRHHAGMFYPGMHNNNNAASQSRTIEAPRSELRRRRDDDDEGSQSRNDLLRRRDDDDEGTQDEYGSLSEDVPSEDNASAGRSSPAPSVAASFGGLPRDPTNGIATDSENSDDQEEEEQRINNLERLQPLPPTPRQRQQQQQQQQQREEYEEQHEPRPGRHERRRQSRRRRRRLYCI